MYYVGLDFLNLLGMLNVCTMVTNALSTIILNYNRLTLVILVR